MGVFRRTSAHPDTLRPEVANGHPNDPEKARRKNKNKEPELPRYNEHGQQINHAGHVVTRGVAPDGESGRTWFHPWHFLRICFRSSSTASMWTNLLWPFTIASLVLHFGYGDHDLWIFITAYLGMVPCANLVGFAGQELARKMPKVAGVIMETTFGSVVEIILFVVLIANDGGNLGVIRAAILGSILANVLFCLGMCFFVGGIFHPQQTFHEAISEVGSNLMLVAAVGLVIPTIYYNSLAGGRLTAQEADAQALKISRGAAVVLLVAFFVYIWFQSRSHHGLYEDILEADEERDHDRHKDLNKDKLTFTESIIAVVVALTFVSFAAVFLVQQIHFMVEERHISDAFLAYDNQMNFALSHVLGSSIQTALLNTPIVVIVGWGLGRDMSLTFELFDAVVLILAIIVVGNFLRDEKSDYLEGALCVFVYILVAVSAWYYPDPREEGGVSSAGSPEGGEGSATASEAVAHAATTAARMMFKV
ncbi:putative vacuolar cation/proton exchanger 2 [Hortaea werneckii]|nr:putative vacuolar cation/proton exchanger 2 [Hortaea werneckii]